MSVRFVMRPIQRLGNPWEIGCECDGCGRRDVWDQRRDPRPPICRSCEVGGQERMRRYLDPRMNMPDLMSYTEMRNRILGEPPPEPPKPEPQRTPEETKEAFAALLAASGIKKTLPLVERVQHEIELGELEEVKVKRAAEAAKLPPNTPPPKVLCPICHDPRCPWSD